MKVCFLTDDPSPIGGGPQHIAQVAKILRQKYHYQVDVVTPKTMDQNFNVNSLGQRIKFAFWILKFILTADYDIFHSHTFSTSAFLPLAKLRGKRTALTVHGLGLELFGGGFINRTPIPRFLRWLILDVWPFDLRFSASRLPGFITVGNGVDVQEFAHLPKIAHKDFTVLCISRRDPVKGVAILEEAVRKVPGAKLHLVSGRQRSLADFARVDIYVLPSLSEGLPLVLLEAMAAKLPIVTTDVGDCGQIVTKANCGLVVPPGDVVGLAKAIKTLKSSQKSLGQNGYNFVREKFTWANVAAKVVHGYQKVS